MGSTFALARLLPDVSLYTGQTGIILTFTISLHAAPLRSISSHILEIGNNLDIVEREDIASERMIL